MEPIVGSPGTLRPMLRLALPVLAEQFLSMLVVLSDTALAGRYLGQQELAAMTLLAYVMWLVPSLFAFVAIGSTAMTARFVGGGEWRDARRTTNQSLLVATGLTVAVMLVLGLFREPLLLLMNAEEEVGPLASRYLGFIVPVLPAIMLTQVGPACLRGAGDTVSGLLVMSVVNVANVAVSWTLVYPGAAGWRNALGLPEMGFDGLAWGTAIGYALGGLIMLAMLLAGRAGLKIKLELLRPDPGLIRRLLRIGVPGGSDLVSVILCQMWYVSIIFHLGQVAAAAHGVAVRIESLAYLPGVAFQVAAATLAGQYLGAGDGRRAGHSVWMACLVGGSVMSAAGLLFFVAAEPLVRLFVSGQDGGEQVISVAAPLLRIVAVAMPALALSMILTGALRGAGDTRWPLLFTFIGLLGVRIPVAYLLTAYWQFGIQGAWYAMVADLAVRCLLVCLRFRQGGWKRVVV